MKPFSHFASSVAMALLATLLLSSAIAASEAQPAKARAVTAQAAAPDYTTNVAVRVSPQVDLKRAAEDEIGRVTPIFQPIPAASERARNRPSATLRQERIRVLSMPISRQARSGTYANPDASADDLSLSSHARPEAIPLAVARSGTGFNDMRHVPRWRQLNPDI